MPQDRRAIQADFVDFKLFKYGGKLPSLLYLLEWMILWIESRIDYHTKRQQLVDGMAISANHSFKVAKMILLNGMKVYDAMYIMMNEYGQVMGWWFTFRTSLDEVDEHLRLASFRS